VCEGERGKRKKERERERERYIERENVETIEGVCGEGGRGVSRRGVVQIGGRVIGLRC